jgi:hypothetical protein
LYDELLPFLPKNSVYYCGAKIRKLNCFESVSVADMTHRPNCSAVLNNVNSDDKGIECAMGKAG